MPRKRSRRTTSNPFDPFDGPLADSTDLHGFTAAETREYLPSYLTRIRKQHPGGLIHIITGKGRGSPGRPVLKGAVKALLQAGHPAVKEWALDHDDGGYLARLNGGR